MTDAGLDRSAARVSARGSQGGSGDAGPSLRTLARLYGVQPAWRGAEDRVHTASVPALVHVLRALGAPVETPGDAPEALRACRAEIEGRLLDPASVLWRDAEPDPRGRGRRKGGPLTAGDRPGVRLRVPGAGATTLHCRLETEDGETTAWDASAEEGAPLALPADLPDGVHRLHVRAGRTEDRQWVIRAPRTAFPGDARVSADRGRAPGPSREWGVFLPLYALRTGRSGGTADLTDLRALAEWTAGRGGRVVGTLPLLATHLGEGLFDPSPYAPVSRLFWNELYVDVGAAPELDEAPEARRVLESTALREAVERLRAADRVDYEASARWKHRALQPLADAVVGDDPHRHPGLRAWLGEHPEALAYARFRAATARQGRGWREWPEPLRAAGADPERLADDAMEPSAFRLHLYAQWLAHRQMDHLGRPGAAGLHLDLPLGTHPDGFDTWRRAPLFARGVTGGAPPDAFFEGGQDWGFPPLHPEALRADGYAYWREALRTQLRHADLLRVDHVMGFHRLFWVPRGLGAREGVYVRYPAEELWALLCLESRRHGTEIVGEDLGTVPREVRTAMDRHGVRRMYVVPFEIREDEGAASEDAESEGVERESAVAGLLDTLTPVPANAVASLGTHDLPPFAAFWRERGAMGKGPRVGQGRSAGIDPTDGEAARVGDDPAAAAPALRRTLAHLAASPARWLLVGLEDLWLETEPQNVPGPDPEGGSWRRKARHSLEELDALPEVSGILDEVDRLRKGPPGDAADPAPPSADAHELPVKDEEYA